MELSEVDLSDIFFRENLQNLSSICYVFDEEVGNEPIAVIMLFKEKMIMISVIDEDDSIDISFVSNEKLKKLTTIDVSSEMPWKNIINLKLSWVWSLKNNQGYSDGIQFEWINKNLNTSIKIQLVTMLSSIRIHKVERVFYSYSSPNLDLK